jgi:hypothetical protein
MRRLLFRRGFRLCFDLSDQFRLDALACERNLAFILATGADG